MLPRILVTGLNGLIGWNIFQTAQQQAELFGTYRKLHLLLQRPDCFRLDLHDSESLETFLNSVNPDYLIHAWSMCDLDLCEQMPQMAHHINVEGVQSVLSAAKRVPSLKKFVYISTDHVFDGEKGQYTEDDSPEPKHVYGRTKLKAEEKVMQSGLPFLIIRPGLTIGNSLQGNKGPKDFLFHRIQAGKPTHYFTDEWRSPVWAEDLAKGVLRLTLSNDEGIFHIAGPGLFNRFDLARTLAGSQGFPTHQIFPRLRKDDKWSHIRPRDISLKSQRFSFCCSKADWLEEELIN